MPDDSSHHVATEGELRGLFAPPADRVIRKQLSKLDKYCRRFIELSPFVCLATSDADGNSDVSPRGDAPGFVRVLDDRTLVIPDRRGNNRLDSLANIVSSPKVGLLFLVPGINETLRVNGTAKIVDDPDVLAAAEANGKRPTVAVVVTVTEAFLHCGKAMIRSKLWAEETQVDRKVLPGLGRMVMEQIEGRELEADEAKQADDWIAESYRTKLY